MKKTTTIYMKNEILDFYYNIFDNFLPENLRKKIKKNEREILRETFQRGWSGFFKNKENSNFSIVSGRKRKSKSGLLEEVLAVQPSLLILESKDTHEEKKTKKVESKSKNEGEIIIQQKIVKTANTNAVINLSCTYNPKFRALNLKFLSLDIKYPGKTEKQYMKELEYELECAQRNFENGYTKDKFLLNFFDTLAANGYTVIDGRDATLMKEIYPNIAGHFPDFEKLTKEQKIKLLYQSALKGRTSIKKDVYSFAQATFMELLKAECANTVVAFDSNSGKVLEYEKVQEYYDKVFDNKRKIYIPNRSRLLFISYKRPQYKTSFMSSSLWNLLVKTRVVEDEYLNL